MKNEIKRDSLHIWEAKNISAGFSEAEGKISNINLKINKGERVALISDDYASRALLLRVLAGLRPIREGDLIVFGQNLGHLPFYADWDEIMPQVMRRRMGICLESEGLLSNVTVREGMELLFRFKYGDHNVKLREGAARVVEATCHRFGISDLVDKRTNVLNRDERRLAGIARAFLSKPPVVILENPSQGVGDYHYQKLWHAISYMQGAGERTMLVSTDDWVLVHKFCNRCLVLNRGELIFDGGILDYIKSDPKVVKRLKSLVEIKKGYERIIEEAS